ncbi:MFS transporter [Actinoplanes sp. NPDC049596]|uniref:MFS transporter n=1 Tax=unclassified Actinoplanes TaxID=2626549 RepID=UPI0034316C19
MLVDAVGAGIFIPFSLVFFTKEAGIPLATVGAVLTLSRLAGILFSMLGGWLADRVDLKSLAVVCMVARAAGYGGYLLVDDLFQFVFVAVFAVAGDRIYWSAHPLIIRRIASDRDRERWFGLVGSTRNLGIAVGAMVAGLLVSASEDAGLRTVVAVQALSFVMAALFLMLQPIAAAGAARVRGKKRATWRVLMEGPEFLALTLAKTQLCFCLLAVPAIVPLYVLETLHAPAWAGSGLWILNCLMVVFLQGPVVAVGETRARTKMLLLSAFCGITSSAIFFLAGSFSGTTVILIATVVAMVVFTVGELTAGPPSDALALRLSPEEHQGRFMATYGLSWSIASVLVPILTTSLLAMGPLWLWSGIALNCAVALSILGWLHRRPEIDQLNRELVLLARAGR